MFPSNLFLETLSVNGNTTNSFSCPLLPSHRSVSLSLSSVGSLVSVDLPWHTVPLGSFISSWYHRNHNNSHFCTTLFCKNINKNYAHTHRDEIIMTWQSRVSCLQKVFRNIWLSSHCVSAFSPLFHLLIGSYRSPVVSYICFLSQPRRTCVCVRHEHLCIYGWLWMCVYLYSYLYEDQFGF